MDEFLSEIPVDVYTEWMEFHATIQPFDPTYFIMRGLMGEPKQKAGGGWEQFKQNLIQHMNITTPRGK